MAVWVGKIPLGVVAKLLDYDIIQASVPHIPLQKHKRPWLCGFFSRLMTFSLGLCILTCDDFYNQILSPIRYSNLMIMKQPIIILL